MNRKIAHRTLLTGLLCMTLPPGSAAQAQTQQSRQVTIIQDLAPVGLIFGQALRYTWSNLNELDPEKHEFEPLRIEVRLLAADGSVIAQEEAAAVGAGQSQIFDFDRDRIPLPGEAGTGRLQARVGMTLSGISVRIIDRPGVPASDSVLKTFVSGAEIIDKASGRTTVGLGGGVNRIILNDSAGNENADLKSDQVISASVGGVYGIVPAQSLFVSALNTADPESREQAEPVNVRVKAYDKDGTVIGESDVVVLPGQFRAVRFDYEDLRMTSEPGTGRKQVRISATTDGTQPSPSVQPFVASGRLLLSFETVDDGTGRTVLSGQNALVFFLGGIPNI